MHNRQNFISLGHSILINGYNISPRGGDSERHFAQSPWGISAAPRPVNNDELDHLASLLDGFLKESHLTQSNLLSSRYPSPSIRHDQPAPTSVEVSSSTTMQGPATREPGAMSSRA